MRCSECGDTKRLNRDGVCEWRAGCEHRVRVRESRELRAFQDIAAELFADGFLRELGFHMPEEDE